MNLKFLHTADWHLGATQHHPKQAEGMLPKLAEMAREKEVDFILCVGDVFDKSKPDQVIKDELIKFLLANEDLTFLFVIGNHDFSDKSRTYHSLRYLQLLKNKLKNVFVLEEKSKIDITFSNEDLIGTRFIVLSEDFSTDWIENDKEQASYEGITIVCCHGILPGVNIKKPAQNEVAHKKSFEILRKTRGSYLALGDIHKHFGISEVCVYPGPLTAKTYSDSSGMYLVDMREDNIVVESLHLDLPKKINIPLEFKDENISEEAIIAFVRDEAEKGNMVRLLFNLPMETWKGLNKEYIKNELLKDYLEIKLDNDPVQEKRTRQSMDKMIKAKDVDEELDIVIKENDFNLDVDKLKKTCRRYLK